MFVGWSVVDSNIRLSADELARLGETSTPLQDSSGDYLGSLGKGETSHLLKGMLTIADVYHELHCVDYIRKYVHSDYYTLPNVIGASHIDHVGKYIQSYGSWQWELTSADHCIDMLRQLVMCKADISVMTFSWHPHVPGPWPKFELNHECRNWDNINMWARERAIIEGDLEIILRPKHDSFNSFQLI